MTNINDYLKSLKHGLFCSRENAKEAMEYSYSLIETLPMKYRIVAFTALHVSLNSVSDDIQKIIDEK